MRLTEMMAFDSRSFTEDERSRFSIALYQSSKKVFDLLEQLLVWSKMERGLMQFSPDLHPLKELVTDSMEIILDSARKKSVELNVEIAEGTEVFADQNMLRTVLRNLISNALKYSHPGSKVSITGRPFDAGSTFIEVRDSGIGMSREIMDNLFRLGNESVRPGTDGEPSSGLGLLICKDLVEKHGSIIKVESEEEKGSAFSFVLPQQTPAIKSVPTT